MAFAEPVSLTTPFKDLLACTLKATVLLRKVFGQSASPAFPVHLSPVSWEGSATAGLSLHLSPLFFLDRKQAC